VVPATLALIVTSATLALPSSGATSSAVILRNALIIREAPPTPVVIGGESAAGSFVGFTLSYYQGLSATNRNSFARFALSTSSSARRDLLTGKIDVALSSTPLNAIGTDVPDGQLSQYLQIPVAATAVALSYNITFPSSVTISTTVGGQQLSATTRDNCPALLSKYPLVLTPTTVAGIFSGQISQWSASVLQVTNPQLNTHALVPVAAAYTSHGVTHPQKNKTQVVNCLRFATSPTITLFGPASGSGVNAIFTDYLSQVDATDFPAPTEAAPAVVGTRLEDSGSLAAAITSTNGALGYLPWSSAQAAGAPTAQLQVVTKGVAAYQPLTSATVRRDLAKAALSIAAKGGFSVLQSADRFDVANAGAGYPLVGLEFAITPRSPSTAVVGTSIAKYLAWLSQTAPSDVGSSFGQSFATNATATPLPTLFQAYDFSQLLTIAVNGSASLTATK